MNSWHFIIDQKHQKHSKRECTLTSKTFKKGMHIYIKNIQKGNAHLYQKYSKRECTLTSKTFKKGMHINIKNIQKGNAHLHQKHSKRECTFTSKTLQKGMHIYIKNIQKVMHINIRNIKKKWMHINIKNISLRSLIYFCYYRQKHNRSVPLSCFNPLVPEFFSLFFMT